jgi:hypothetical protein
VKLKHNLGQGETEENFPEPPLAENGKNPGNVDGWSRREEKGIDNRRGLNLGYMKLYCMLTIFCVEPIIF